MKSATYLAFAFLLIAASVATAQQPAGAGGGQTIGLALGLQRDISCMSSHGRFVSPAARIIGTSSCTSDRAHFGSSEKITKR